MLTNLSWHVPALLLLDAITVLDRHRLAVLPGHLQHNRREDGFHHLARHVVTLLGRNVAALLFGYAVALLKKTNICPQKAKENKILDRSKNRLIWPIH